MADEWAGGEMRVFTLTNSITMTDGPTDEWTDGRTKPLIKLRVRAMPTKIGYRVPHQPKVVALMQLLP